MFYKETEKISHISYLTLYVLFLSSDHTFLELGSVGVLDSLIYL